MAKKKESGTTSVTIRVPNEVLAIVDRIAATEDRSRAYVIKRCLSVHHLCPVRPRSVSESEHTAEQLHRAAQGFLATLPPLPQGFFPMRSGSIYPRR